MTFQNSTDALTYLHRHVVLNEVTIDVNVLLHLVEQVSLDMTMNSRNIQAPAAAFHDLLLPRAWILYAVRHQRTLKAQEIDLVAFLDPMRALLAKIYHWDGSGRTAR